MNDIQPIISNIAALIFVGFLLYAAVNDIRSFTISNRLNLIFGACFLIFFLPIGLDFRGLAVHFAVALIAFLIGFILFAIGAWGGGDAKLLAATAFWLGPNAMMPYAMATALSGGLLAVILLISRYFAKKYGLPKSPRWLRQILRKRAQVPYGVALCIGGIFAIANASWR